MNDVKREQCYGCSACASVCGYSAIQMEADKEGFLYPHIDESKCVGCGLCEKVCPALNRKTNAESTVQHVYAIQHHDKSVLQTSASGGFFTAVSDAVLAEGGVVYGAAFDENMIVRHVRATKASERDRMKGSKYVQSDIGNTYQCVKQDLKEEKEVLFTGTPCQVDGLIRFLRGKTDNLLCIDLICHGTPSPLIFADHIKMLEKKAHARVVDYSFRPKEWSWHVHREIAYLSNGKAYHSNAYSDLWRTVYYAKLVTKPSCHHCQYSCLARTGDITIGDCRGIDRICPDFGSAEGASLILINTSKGAGYFESVRAAMKLVELRIEDVMQPPLKEPSKQSKERTKFWTVYHKRGYMQAIYACMGKLYWLKYNVKKVMNKN